MALGGRTPLLAPLFIGDNPPKKISIGLMSWVHASEYGSDEGS
jgi:hypothetical protein